MATNFRCTERCTSFSRCHFLFGRKEIVGHPNATAFENYWPTGCGSTFDPGGQGQRFKGTSGRMT